MTTRPTERRPRPEWAARPDWAVRADRDARPGRALRVGAVGVSLAACLVLAGCSGNDPAQNDASATQAAATQAPAAPPTGRPTGPPTGTGVTSGPPATDGTGASGSLRSGRCRSVDLTGSITEGNGGAAGSVEPYLVLTNTGRSSCTLQGYPGVSLVGGGNGTQIGTPATRDGSSEPATVTLQPKHSAHAPMRLVQAGNYDAATCDPKPADGFRVYPPGEKGALYVKAPGYTACASASVKLLTVQAVQPGAA